MDTVCDFIESVNSTNSNLEKQEILKKYVNDKTVTKVISYTLDPIKQYNVSSKNVKKYKTNKKYNTQEFRTYKNMFKMLDDLNSRVITGNEALKTVNEYVKNLNEKHQSIIPGILCPNNSTFRTS